MIARHLTITGKVQGVFYRGWTVEMAFDLGLTGWVRNRRNGDVEALIQGKPEDVERFVELAQRGPTAARVKTVDVSEAPVGFLQGFEQRATA